MAAWGCAWSTGQSLRAVPGSGWFWAVVLPRHFTDEKTEAHKFSWLDGRDSPGLSDAQEQHHCVQGVRGGDTSVPLLCLDHVCQWPFSSGPVWGSGGYGSRSPLGG